VGACAEGKIVSADDPPSGALSGVLPSADRPSRMNSVTRMSKGPASTEHDREAGSVNSSAADRPVTA
jgi:hypothetical protein